MQEDQRHTLPDTMQAVAIDRFGGLEELKLQTLPVPEVGPEEVLIRIESADIAVWDPFEREGGFVDMMPGEPRFPYVLGSDGAGTIAAVGERIDRFGEGDRVYAANVVNPKGGFYAEYAAVPAGTVSPIPKGMSLEQAGVMSSDALTGLQGLDQELGLQQNESVMIFGAGGGIGHLAVQLARRMDARVFAVASGEDGVAFVKRLGADAVVDGRKDDVASAARDFAPAGLDAALLTAGGAAAEKAMTAIREGGRAAYPDGVTAVPKAPPGVRLHNYSVAPEPQMFGRLNRLIETEVEGSPPFEVHISRTFPLDQVADAHRYLEQHYLGKLALRVVPT